MRGGSVTNGNHAEDSQAANNRASAEYSALQDCYLANESPSELPVQEVAARLGHLIIRFELKISQKGQ